ncbi:acetate permease [Burkholderia pseudomallei 1106b]|nr:acetate permease [Burkholderia pseudomallei 1106b]
MPATRAGGCGIGGRSRRASPYPAIDRAPHASRCGARRFLGRGRPVDRGAKMACGRRRVVSILAPKRRSAEAPKRRSAEAPKRRSAEAPKRRSAEAPKRRSAEAPKRRNAETPKHRSTEAPKRRSAEAPKRRSTEAPKHRSAEPSMLRTPPLRAPARVSPIPGALQYRADRPRAGHLGAFLPPARRDRVPRALLIR